MIVVTGIRVPYKEDAGLAVEQACRKMGVDASEVESWKVRRLSFDARREQVTKVFSLVLTLADPQRELALTDRPDVAVYRPQPMTVRMGRQPMASRPVIAGFGPAGIFAAYLLAEYGYRPIVLERGGDIGRRVSAVEGFFGGGKLDEETNVQFGEGGAGTFSDGKLTTRIKDPLCEYVLETFAAHGAPEDILYSAKPHIGTDRLRRVIPSMRRAILDNGGEVRFSTRLDEIVLREGRVKGIKSAGEELPAETVILACGHSARDTFKMLIDKGAALSAKPFSVGLRIEHLQLDIDRALYGKLAEDPDLPRGEYALSTRVGGRGVYTFCMCPGGSVVAAASQQGGVVTNGMSYRARAGANANSAVAVSVGAGDFSGPLEAVAFQRKLEQAAYDQGKGGFCAPAQDVGSFLTGKAGLKLGRVRPSYPLGVEGGDLEKLLGASLCADLRQGIRAFGRKLRGFDAADAVLTGIESRTSSPVRMEREQDYQAIGMEGIYPCGEGAGYAGGIMSAAVDGIRCALAVMARYGPG